MEIELIEQTGIAEYSKTEAALSDLRERMANVEYDVTTTKGMEIAKKDRAEVRGLRTGLEAMRKQIKAPALAHCQLIDAEAKRITAELLKLEEPIDAQIKARELALEAERQARELAERQRITAIHERIASITGYHALALECRTADRVQSLLDKMEAVWVAFNHEEDFGEFGAEAQSAYLTTGASLAAIIEQKRIEDAERAAIKAAQVAEAARLADEKAATEAAAKKLADERKAFEEEQAAFRATQAAAQAAVKAEREAAERAAAEQKAKEEADAAARELEAYAAAISALVADVQVDVAPVEPTPVFADTVVSVTGPRPSDKDMVNAVASAFNVDYITALDWMESIDFHELNR